MSLKLYPVTTESPPQGKVLHGSLCPQPTGFPSGPLPCRNLALRPLREKAVPYPLLGPLVKSISRKEKKYKLVGPPVQISALRQPGPQLVGFPSTAEASSITDLTLFLSGPCYYR